MGILDSLKFLDKSREQNRGLDGEGAQITYSSMQRQEPPSVLDSLGIEKNVGTAASQGMQNYSSSSTSMPSYMPHKSLSSAPPAYVTDSRMFPLGAQELGASVLHQHNPTFTVGTAPFSGYAAGTMQTAGHAEQSFQPSGLSQDQLRAIYEGRGEAPRREMPGRSVVEYVRPQLGPEPMMASFVVGEQHMSVQQHLAMQQYPPMQQHLLMSRESMPSGMAPQHPGLSMAHEAYLKDGGQTMYSSRRYTLADRSKWGDMSAAPHIAHLGLHANVLSDGTVLAPADTSHMLDDSRVVRTQDREGQLIRSIFPEYQPGNMSCDFLRAPLIPHSETSVEDARPLFGPLPVSDREFVVGRMDFQSMPTWTDSLVQYLKQDPTYFTKPIESEQFSTQMVRHDLVQVKINDGDLRMEDQATFEAKASDTATGPALRTLPQGPPVAGLKQTAEPHGHFHPQGQQTQQRTPPPAQRMSPKEAAPPVASASPQDARQASAVQTLAAPTPAPPTVSPAPPAPPASARQAGGGGVESFGAAGGAGAAKAPPPKKKTGGIADRLAAFQKAVQDSGTT